MNDKQMLELANEPITKIYLSHDFEYLKMTEQERKDIIVAAVNVYNTMKEIK